MMSKREWLALAGVLLLAGVLRMGWPGLTEFKKDEAHIYQLALGMAEFRAFPLRGITYSVGLPESPVSIYLFALPLFIWKSPLAATLFMGLLNTLSVGVAYWIARRYWGVRAALCAALLYATAPWAVVFSRKIWNNNLLPLFVSVYVASGLLAFVEGRTRWLIAHGLAWSIAFQLHISAIFFLPVTLVLMALYRRRLQWRPIFYAGAAAALAGLPYAIYLLSRFREWSRAITGMGGRTLQFSLDAVAMAALLIQGTHLEGLGGAAALPAFRAAVSNLEAVFWAGGALVAGGVLITLWRALKRDPNGTKAREAGLMVTAWLVTPILLFIPHTTPVYPWYFIILFPLPYLLSGVTVDFVQKRWPRWGGALAVMVMSLAVCQVWAWAATLDFIATRDTPGAFGTPLEKLLLIAEQTRGADEALVVSAGDNPEADTIPAVFSALLAHTPHRFVDGRTTAIFPAQGATVIVWPSADSPGAQTYEEWNVPQTTVPLRAGEGEALIFRADGSAPAVPFPREASALLSNGAEVLGSGGNAGAWELWWRAPGPADTRYHVFAHLLDASGARVAQVDEATPADWRAGDLVINFFALNGAGATMRAGMYTYPSLEPVSVLNANAEPAGEWIEFPLGNNQ